MPTVQACTSCTVEMLHHQASACAPDREPALYWETRAMQPVAPGTNGVDTLLSNDFTCLHSAALAPANLHGSPSCATVRGLAVVLSR
jgi:hypothetical protein